MDSNRIELTVFTEPAPEGGFCAYCAEFPSANGQGNTQQEAMDDLMDSIHFVMQCEKEMAFEKLGESEKSTAQTLAFEMA